MNFRILKYYLNYTSKVMIVVLLIIIIDIIYTEFSYKEENSYRVPLNLTTQFSKYNENTNNRTSKDSKNIIVNSQKVIIEESNNLTVELENHSRIKTRFEIRSKLLNDACREENIEPTDTPVSFEYRMEFFFQYNTCVCTIAKSGSSTWRTHVRKVNHGPTSQVPMSEDPRKIKFLRQDKQLIIENIFKQNRIITVRHPLKRLISAFYSKFNGGILDQYFPQHEKRLMKKRVGSTWAQRFERYWILAMENNKMLPDDLHLQLNLSEPFTTHKQYPTSIYLRIVKLLKPRLHFYHFLKHVTIESMTSWKMNAHWLPYTKSCDPCFFDYQYITKIETMTEDLNYIFRHLKIPSNARVDENSLRDTDRTSRLFKNVPVLLRRKIYDIYKLDFKLFDYDVPTWFLNE